MSKIIVYTFQFFLLAITLPNFNNCDGMIYYKENLEGKVIHYMQNILLTECVIKCTNLESYASFTKKEEVGECNCVKHVPSENMESMSYTIYRPTTHGKYIFNIVRYN